MDASSPPDIVIVAGGDPLDAATAAWLRALDVQVVAADHGLDHAHAAGLTVGDVVGDMDSVTTAALSRAAKKGTTIHRYPEAKDRTDLELALDLALESAPARVLVVGVGGGRFDHHLANLLTLASPVFAPIDIELRDGTASGWIVRDELVLRTRVGGLVSVLPLHGAAVVSEGGMRWTLDHQRLEPGSTRGVSNVATSPAVEITVHDGVVAVLAPDHHRTEAS